MNDILFKFLVNLRKKIKDMIPKIKDATPYSWNQYTNYDYECNLQKLFVYAAQIVEDFGVVLVKMYHHPHYSSIIETYDPDTIGKRKFKISDYNNYETGCFIIMKAENVMCPRCRSKQGKEHEISVHYFIDKQNTVFAKKYLQILHFIYNSVENCGYRNSRSSIREPLHKALIELNDLILPQTIDSYIDNHLKSISI